MFKSVHFEGLPGSGKTSASQSLSRALDKAQISAKWYLEEDKNHPITSERLRRHNQAADFDNQCLEAWIRFQSNHSGIQILDGYALQSTVRLMFANQVRHTQIVDYFERWAEAGKGHMEFVFFYVDAPQAHFQEIIADRGEKWARLLERYVQRTPYGQTQNLTGRVGLVEFWARYQEMCIHLLSDRGFKHTRAIAHDWGEKEEKELVKRLA